ncbi:Nramp family divalent metal transporter [Planctomicrobium sp.]|jgi:manganese transport protein|nr:Nramp family divalent metal transporter [Planctomicrobium sp.]MDB4733224.1 Nramp family divalent metal transporter [Planctomicrobium sp.]
MNEPPNSRPWYTRIGPGLITACVVIGPGSIMTSSSIGANNEYSMLWVVAVSVAFMMTYMTMGARLGAVANASPCDLIREKAGRWLAILVGGCVFFIATAFQSGNNIAVAAAFKAFLSNVYVVAGLVILFNGIAITFLFAFKDLYKMLERIMMAFVGLMLISFAINLVQLQPDVGELLRGFIPDFNKLDFTKLKTKNNLDLLALLGTTFVVAAAFYQAYLVKQKGWHISELKSGLIDARVGSIIMALITIMLMSTAAAGLYTGEEVELKDPVAVATALESTFGPSAKIIFCLGLFSAAYSSFIVNSIIGGFIFADGLGIGSKPTDLWPRLLTTLALLIGMSIGLAVLLYDINMTPTIIAAQAVTIIGAPLIAGVLLWLTSRKDVMGEHVNGTGTKIFAGLGFIVLLALASKTLLNDIPDKYKKYRESNQATATAMITSNDSDYNDIEHTR